MALCCECKRDFAPDYYHDVCNLCGMELSRQYERMQDFDSGELTLAEVVARIAEGARGPVRRRWRVG